MFKVCPKCKRKLHDIDFNWKIIGIRRAVHCKECSRAYIRNHYKNNQKYYVEKAHKRNLEFRQKAHEYIGSFLTKHPCVDCGETDILVLEFDHKDRSVKKGEISVIIRGGKPFKEIVEEISKCDVRCANCHRRKTAKESSSWKLKYLHP